MRRPAIHIRLHPDLHKRIEATAAEQHLDKTAIVTIALNEFFAKRDAEEAARRKVGGRA